jgi:hypothetical protein
MGFQRGDADTLSPRIRVPYFKRPEKPRLGTCVGYITAGGNPGLEPFFFCEGLVLAQLGRCTIDAENCPFQPQKTRRTQRCVSSFFGCRSWGSFLSVGCSSIFWRRVWKSAVAFLGVPSGISSMSPANAAFVVAADGCSGCPATEDSTLSAEQ